MSAKPSVAAPVVSPVAVKPYDGSGPNEWSFVYDGPMIPQDVATCDMCTAASRGACPTRGHNNETLHCSSCFAAKVKHCHNHCGIGRALAEHANTHVLGPADQVTFALVQRTIVEAVPQLRGENVYVKAVATERRVSLDILTR
jgi:hypothetical protein